MKEKYKKPRHIVNIALQNRAKFEQDVLDLGGTKELFKPGLRVAYISSYLTKELMKKADFEKDTIFGLVVGYNTYTNGIPVKFDTRTFVIKKGTELVATKLILPQDLIIL